MSAADQRRPQGYQRRRACSQLVTLTSGSGRVLDRRRCDRHRAIRSKGHLAEPKIAPRHLGANSVGRPGVVEHPHLAGLSDESTMARTGSDIVRSQDRLLGLDKRSEWAICDRMPNRVLRSRLPRLRCGPPAPTDVHRSAALGLRRPSTRAPRGTTNHCLPEAQTVGGTKPGFQNDAVTMRELIFTSSEPRDKKQSASPACV